jgi:hypothetical protein
VRGVGLVVFLIGLVLVGGGLFVGCGSLFSWNGRHPVAVSPLTLGTPAQRTLRVKGGQRYTLAVQVVFERDGLAEQGGALVVEAKMPLAASIKGPTGDGPEVVGWLDPAEPPTTLFGHAADAETQRRPNGSPPPELAAQRMLGPYLAPGDGEATFAVTLGPDRVGRARIREARAVVFDDVMPSSVKWPFYAAGAGGVATAAGLGLLVVGLFRGKRGGSRRRKNV